MKDFINCKVCGKQLSGRQLMFCSGKCKNKVHQSYGAQKERALERKLYFIRLLGGKCQECGYSENLAALSFHHKSGKEYKLDSRSLSNRGLQTMRDEVAKCELLCGNCHMRLHNPSLDLAKLSIEPTALTTELQAREIATNSKGIIAKKALSVKEFGFRLTTLGIERETKLVLGVSGGVDSVVMLDLVASCLPKQNMVIAHVNHGFRDDSDKDERFVRSLAKKYDITYTSTKLKPHNMASNESGNLEEYFRDKRRRFLQNAAKKYDAGYVALAHNADDQAETVLMNLVRGSGPAGLSGMKEREGKILRPLLGITKTEIIAYAEIHKLKWHEDTTNTDTSYNRNYLRHRVLPLLGQLNPEYLANISRSATIQEEIDELLKERAKWLVEQLHTNTSVSAEVPRPILYEALAQMYEKVKGDRKELSLAHLEAVAQLASDDQGTKTLDLPGNVTARRRYNHLDFVLKMRDNKAPIIAPLELSLGHSNFGNYNVEITESNRADSKDKYSILLSSLEGYVIRAVLPGDKVAKTGMEGHKKLQDLFVDAKIDRQKRSQIPLLVGTTNNEVLWIPGLAKSRNLDNKKPKYSITISEASHENR